jgi:hypothetical protein
MNEKTNIHINQTLPEQMAEQTPKRKEHTKSIDTRDRANRENKAKTVQAEEQITREERK